MLASGLSGFYFAIFLVLWTLVLRGIAIEFRSHVELPLWRTAWDAGFWAASTLLPVLFGAALGNLLRGLPIGEDRWFSLPLFTSFSTTPPVGILDWYTVCAGLFAWLAIAGHGASFLAWKTGGIVHERSRIASLRFFAAVTIFLPFMTIATAFVNPAMPSAFAGRPLAWLALALSLAGLGTVHASLRGNQPLRAFLGSCAFLAGLLSATAATVFPVMLRAIDDESRSLTAYNASSPESSLMIAFGWWIVGFPLAVLYFVLLFRIHRGKVIGASGRHGY